MSLYLGLGILGLVLIVGILNSSFKKFDKRQVKATIFLGVLGALILLLPLSWRLYTMKYGWTLFLFYPFSLGLLTSLLFNYNLPRKLSECVGVTLTSLALTMILFMLVKFEGAICILMAFPIFVLLGISGAFIGYLFRNSKGNHKCFLMLSLIILNPMMMGFESRYPKDPPLDMIRTCVVVKAPIQSVWNILTSHIEYGKNEGVLFRAGVNYPISSELIFQENKYFLKCQTKEGLLMAPVTVFEPNKRLTFRPLNTPPPMKELSIYFDIHPAHLDGHFRIQEGTFSLTSLQDGSTRLEGITLYEHEIWPTQYWRLWSHWIIDRMHRKVLSVIKERTESELK